MSISRKRTKKASPKKSAAKKTSRRVTAKRPTKPTKKAKALSVHVGLNAVDPKALFRVGRPAVRVRE